MIPQICIAFTGLIAIWLTQQSRPELKKYACLFGLASQPFWFHTTYMAEQWGIFGLSFIYSAMWLVGFKNHWVTK